VSCFLKKTTVVVACLLFLVGCNQIYSNFDESIEKIEQLVEQSKWDEASDKLNKMKKTYDKSYQWKDFYIDDPEYKELVKMIGNLEGTINQKDKKQANIQLAMLKAFIKDIYYK
jgi:hypothetical protein